jgi:hypothetical protein
MFVDKIKTNNMANTNGKYAHKHSNYSFLKSKA